MGSGWGSVSRTAPWPPGMGPPACQGNGSQTCGCPVGGEAPSKDVQSLSTGRDVLLVSSSVIFSKGFEDLGGFGENIASVFGHSIFLFDGGVFLTVFGLFLVNFDLIGAQVLDPRGFSTSGRGRVLAARKISHSEIWKKKLSSTTAVSFPREKRNLL